MQNLTEYVIRSLGLAGFNAGAMAATLIVVVALGVSLLVLTIGGIITWAERRVAGRTQLRVGPNRVGPLGFLQWLADGVKLITKEDVIPREADHALFRLAPYPVVVGVFSAFVTIPFGRYLIAADLNVGLLYLVAITSLVVVGVLMAGWSSNNKWALLGGVRSAAQMVSYEVPSVVALMSIIVITGTMSLQGIIAQQGGWPWQWLIFYNPFTFVAFFLYFTAAVAEGNRTPFDLPEAESELVAGYNVEYSGMRFAGFFLGEFANVYLMSAIAACVFFGGWQVPGVSTELQSASVALQTVGVIVLLVKASFGSFVVLWLRWTLPRLRVDQLMGLCFRFLLPLSFVMLLGNAFYVWKVKTGSMTDGAVKVVTTGIGVAVVAWFVSRVVFHLKHTSAHISLDLARGEAGVFDPEQQVRRYGKFRKSKESM
jgi:NADH-quinone oxidoreductase subunit H